MFLILAGATYQGVATALERRRFPRPGSMVDVGGHQLHIYCIGEGAPTVVLEAPAAGMSAAWGWVQPQVARMTRVCSYDRAGLGWSEASDGPYDPTAVARELHTLLDHARENGPFVVAGHGLGAAFATLFASRFGVDASALILVDAPVRAEEPFERSSLTRSVGMSPWLARTGILRATGMLSSSAVGMPQPSGGALCAFLNRPDHLMRAARELSRWDEVMTLAAAAVVPADVPVIRVDAAGRERVVFLTSESEAMPVVAAILDAVGDVRGGR
jgi:pimeloyl-ACP methyl ester carboxylesterase